MATQNVLNINITDRTVFDNIPTSEKDGNLYFVREGTRDTYKLLSLYYGNTKQCDVTDLTDTVNVDFSNYQNNYNIPQTYQVKGKMLFSQQIVPDSLGNSTQIYRAIMWNGTSFVDCFGEPNNVIICDTLPGTPTKDYVYIDLSTNYLYVYDGTQYINIISDDEYATVEYVQDIYNTLMSIINEMSGKGSGSVAGIPFIQTFGAISNVTGIPIIVITPTVDGVPVAQPYAVSKFLYSTSLPYGDYGTSVKTRLEISEESSHTTLQSGGAVANGMCYYSVENQIGAYAGYEFDETYRIDSVKLWIGIAPGQNITLYVTVQYLGTDDTWNDVETVSVGPTTSYPSNVATVQFNSNIPVKGVRWIHKDQPIKSSGNNITFAGMTVYRAT